jgi:GTP-binding nuclear protein Ran
MAPQTQYKLLIVGDAGVGKSSLARRYTLGQWSPNYTPTRQTAVSSFASDDLFYSIWDFSGQEKFVDRAADYRGADCAIIMFEVGYKSTFRNIFMWYNDIRKTCGDIPIVLCGNKCDLAGRAVTAESILRFQEKTNMPYFEISTRSGEGIDAPITHFSNSL